MGNKIRIGALISGGGSNLQAIMDCCENGKISGELSFIGSDNPRAHGLKRAAAAQIPAFVVDYASIIQQFKADPATTRLPADFDYFMRTLTPYFIDRVNLDRGNPRIMNIHPALLPAFPGTDGYGDTFRYGCKVAGSTVHFIDYGEDTGPIIGQRAFAIAPGDTLESIRKKGLELEWALYPKCIQLFAEGRLKTIKKTYTLAGGQKRQRSIVEILPKVE